MTLQAIPVKTLKKIINYLLLYDTCMTTKEIIRWVWETNRKNKIDINTKLGSLKRNSLKRVYYININYSTDRQSANE